MTETISLTISPGALLTTLGADVFRSLTVISGPGTLEISSSGRTWASVPVGSSVNGTWSPALVRGPAGTYQLAVDVDYELSQQVGGTFNLNSGDYQGIATAQQGGTRALDTATINALAGKIAADMIAARNNATLATGGTDIGVASGGVRASVAPQDDDRRRIIIRADSANTSAVRIGPVGFASSAGLILEPGERIELDTTAALEAISTGDAGSLSILELKV